MGKNFFAAVDNLGRMFLFEVCFKPLVKTLLVVGLKATSILKTTVQDGFNFTNVNEPLLV